MGVIAHSGKVVKVDGTRVLVEVERGSACVGCQVSGVCNASERETQLVSAELRQGQYVEVGDVVRIVGRKGMGWKAVLVAYVVPTVLLVAIVAFGSVALGWSDGVAGGVALGAAGLYGVVLWLIESWVGKEFSFVIED